MPEVVHLLRFLPNKTGVQLDKRPDPLLRGEYIYIFRVAFKVVEQLGATERFGRALVARSNVVKLSSKPSAGRCDSVPALAPEVVSLS